MEISSEDDTVVAQLSRENACLREQLAFYENLGQGCTFSSQTPFGPIAHILYFDTPISVCYRQKIEELVVGASVLTGGENTSPDYQPNAVQVKHFDGGTALKVTGAVEYYVDFCIDRLGTPMVCIGDELSMDASLIGYYSQVYTELPWDNVPAGKEDGRPRRLPMKCFNCDGDHHLKDCPKPKDFAKISANRQSFSTPGSDKRYHVGMAGDYGKKFVPGKLSDKLKQALGMASSSYPPYINRMKELGYPPGYRLLQSSESLVLYGEEGPSGTRVALESREIIYPGFNDQEIETVDMDLDEGKTQAQDFSQETDQEESTSYVGYEFEEGEILEDALILRQMETKSQEVQVEKETQPSEIITLNDSSKGGTESPAEAEPSRPRRYSLDFPPGLVHDISECETSPKRWNALKKLLSEKKSGRKSSKQFSFSLQ